MKKLLILNVFTIIYIFSFAQNSVNLKTVIGKKFIDINTISVFKDFKEEAGASFSGLKNKIMYIM